MINKEKKIIFIASYPKSGNTWLRSIISSLVYNSKGNFTFDDLKNIKLFSQFVNFKKLKGYENNLKTNIDYNWISHNWIKAQEHINYVKKNIVFFKTHSVRGLVNKNYFTDESVCLGFIYIIRDPRDIVVSLAKHMGIENIQATDKMLFDSKHMTSFAKVNELISTWKNNVDSWMQFQNVPRLILKYEDMINDIDNSIYNIAEFINNISNLNIKTNKKFLNLVKDATSFRKLQFLENNKKFDEATQHSKFFRKGISGGWVKTLTKIQTKKIEDELNVQMKQLGYL